MDQRRIGPVAALALALFSSCATTTGGDPPSGAAAAESHDVGAPAPPLSVKALSGKTIEVSSYRGKVVLLDVWASWCGPCKQELPMLDAMASRLHGRGIEVLAVSIDQERENVVKFLRGRSRWALTVAHDPKGQIADRLQPDRMPTSYIIDRAGIIRYVNRGFQPSDADLIERHLIDVAAQ
jgi:thiol-disulfide isomerase/thioredoxin